MAREIEIFVEITQSSQVDHEAVRRWLDHLGAVGYEIPEDATPSDTMVGLAAKRCYLSFEVGLNKNVTRVRRDWFEYMGSILESGHGSVLEHAHYTFAIEGVSRVFTGEMNRHRAGVAISEGSMRYIRFDNMGYWVPQIWRACENDPPDLAEKKRRSREVLARSFVQAEANYGELAEIWDIDNMPSFHDKKRQTSAFRRTTPMGVATGVVYTFNFRSLRHIIALRSTPEAEEEICYVTSLMAKMMVDREPAIFGDFQQDENGFWRPMYWKV